VTLLQGDSIPVLLRTGKEKKAETQRSARLLSRRTFVWPLARTIGSKAHLSDDLRDESLSLNRAMSDTNVVGNRFQLGSTEALQLVLPYRCHRISVW
jgi:hypothetical protein